MLIEFVEAVLADDPSVLSVIRTRLFNEVGAIAFVDICATVASFNAVVKLADATGIPLEGPKFEKTQDIRRAYAIDDLQKST